MLECKVKINKNGHLVIPASYRQALGIKPGDQVILRLEEDELHVSNIKHALKRARKLVKQCIKTNKDLTESLINNRRRGAL